MILFPTQRSVILIGFLCLLEGTVLSQEQADTSTPQHYKITGQVTDELEKPIPNAKTWLQVDFNEKSIFAMTDESGNFEIICPSNIKNKTIHFWDLYLWVQASDYNLKCVRPQMASKEFLPSKVVLNRDDYIVLVVLDENGKPCPDATVEPYYFDVPNGVYYSDQSTGLISILPKDIAEGLRVTTDKNGEAEFQGIPIRQFNGAYCFTTGMVPQLFRFTGKGKLSFQLRPTGKVRGKVVCDEHVLPVPDWTTKKVFISSQEKPNADQNIRLNQPDQEFSTPVQCHQFIELDREGCFELDGVLSGMLTASINLGNTEMQPIPNQPVRLNTNDVLNLEIKVAKAVPVEGTLLTEDTREPLASVRVSIYRSVEHSLDTTSDANGKFKCFLHPGDYIVQPIDMSPAKQAKDYSYAQSANIRVTSNMDTCKIPDLLFPRLERETGKLVDADGKPLAKRRVALIPVNSNHSIKYGYSDDQGKLEIRYTKGEVNLGQKTKWVIYPKNNKSVEGDVRQYPTLIVKEESPLVLVLSSED
jgi:hypothetical protein